MIQLIKNQILIKILNEIEGFEFLSNADQIARSKTYLTRRNITEFQIEEMLLAHKGPLVREACKSIVRESNGRFGLTMWEHCVVLQGSLPDTHQRFVVLIRWV